MSSCYLIVDHKGIHPGVRQLFNDLQTGSRWCVIAIFPNKRVAFVFSIEQESYKKGHFDEVRSFFTKKELLENLALFLEGQEVYIDFDIIPYKIIEELKNHKIAFKSAETYRQKVFSLTPQMVETHIEANYRIERIIKNFVDWFTFREDLCEKKIVTWLFEQIEKEGMETVSQPIVAFRENSALPHYHMEGMGALIQSEGPLLIDLWARLKEPNAIYADRTFMFMVNRKPQKKEIEAFNAVLAAQKNAFDSIQEKVRGYEVDQAARKVLIDRGFRENIFHRTGHSIDRNLHGLSMHFDSIEEPDLRTPEENMVMSIEPAVYLENRFGVRLESNIYLDSQKRPHWTNPLQNEWILLSGG